MAMDKLKNSIFAQGSTKQKVILVATIIIFIIVIWQIVGLFGGGGESTAPPPTPASAPRQMSATSPSGAAGASVAAGGVSPGASAAGGVSSGAAMPLPSPDQLAMVSPLNMSGAAELLKGQQEQQKNYVDSLNQLQLLKVKREIAVTNQAIAAARLATATADKNMSDLLTQPAAPQVPAGAYASKLAGQQLPGGYPPGMSETVTPVPPLPAEITYVVISVSMQFNRWTAVLGSQGKLYNVAVGDVLADGERVLSISKSGVILEKEGKSKKISIISSI